MFINYRSVVTGIYFILMALAVALGITTLASRCSASEAAPDWSHAVILDQAVNMRTAMFVSQELQEYAAQPGVKEVVLVIDSPGGEITSGRFLLDSMESVRAGGIKIKCYVPHLAASMAFSILTHCDSRIGLPASQFLWHTSRVVLRGPMTAPQLQDMARKLAELDATLFEDMAEASGISIATLASSISEDLLDITKVQDILGSSFISVRKVVPTLLNPPASVPRAPEPDLLSLLFGGSSTTTPRKPIFLNIYLPADIREEIK